MVRFTPNGLSVSERERAISLVRSSGVGWVSAVIRPGAPALETAATSSARPTHCMPPWAIGCSTPNISVNRVLIMSRFLSSVGYPEGTPHGVQTLLLRRPLPAAEHAAIDDDVAGVDVTRLVAGQEHRGVGDVDWQAGTLDRCYLRQRLLGDAGGCLLLLFRRAQGFAENTSGDWAG